MHVMITGAAGFIGSTLGLRLLARGDRVYGVDNMNDYYDVTLKEARLARLQANSKFTFQKLDIADRAGMERLFKEQKFDAVVNLAAQAGVRYSIENPHAYVDANLVGFANVLEGCRHSKVGHLVFASSSSVYGANTKLPFSEHDNVDHPVSLYAASKKANELMAHSYAHLYELPCTGLRFFTVYGPWGRPDMALFKFTKGIIAGEPIPVFNHRRRRDSDYRQDRRCGPDLDRKESGSSYQLCSMARLQYRQQQSREAHAVHRGARAVPRQEGQARPDANAAGRRAGNLCQHRRAAWCGRF